MAMLVPNGVSAWARSASRSEPGLRVGQAPVGAGGERRVGGVGDRFQLVHAALDDDVAPVVREVRVEGAEVGHRGMDVAVDAAWFDEGHARVLSGRLPMRRINVGATTVQLSENASMPCFPQYFLRRLDNPCRVRSLVWSSQWCAVPTVNMLEAKSNLSRLVEAVETGAETEIIIARNGRPAAQTGDGQAIPDRQADWGCQRQVRRPRHD